MSQNALTFPLPSSWKVVATGFGPFGLHSWNPSRVVAKEMAVLLPSRILYKELPVTFRAAAEWSRPVDPHTLIIHFGLAAQAKEVRIEQRAQNCTGSTPDNEEVVPPDTLRDDGLEELLIGFDTASLIQRLRESGPGLVLPSRDAGTYVCNATLYHSLHAAPGRSLFVHLPPMNEPTCVQWAHAFTYALFGDAVRPANLGKS